MDIDSCCLDGNADAVEFCPHYPYHHVLAAATYNLKEGVEPSRRGKNESFFLKFSSRKPLERFSQILAFSMDIDSCCLDGNADAVEFCPHYPYHHVLAAATYYLKEGVEPSRRGSLSVYSVRADTRLELLNRVEMAGIFDVKWRHV
ncbi:hypothetical protein QJS10_CPB15g02164 [Acorus calamus]|uniref:Uncharacterized protein n=1 Tax=Acorus calamus TaxID=4465 RepID=A0AAV9D5A3_ACOCL|nr:hypothetical protein QJS10_CPB15g02164 [Acorus calamus]